MTYRTDSTIHLPHGRITRKDAGIEEVQEWLPYDEEQFKLSLKSKSKSFFDLTTRPKLVAWIVSNCNAPSGRNEYVERLQEEIPGERYETMDNSYLKSPVKPLYLVDSDYRKCSNNETDFIDSNRVLRIRHRWTEK